MPSEVHVSGVNMLMGFSASSFLNEPMSDQKKIIIIIMFFSAGPEKTSTATPNVGRLKTCLS